MSVSLATLVSRLTGAAPARNGVPSAGQYEECVRDAVADFSQRRPNQKVYTVSIVSGTAAYSLPSDFLRPVRLEALLATDGVLISDAGLIPVDALEEEIISYAGQTLTITPTPQYTTSRRLVYAAGHVLDSNDSYPDLTADEGRTVLLKAQALAVLLQATAATTEGWKYQIGDEMVDKSGLAKGLAGQAAVLDAAYERAVRGGMRAFGMRGESEFTGYTG